VIQDVDIAGPAIVLNHDYHYETSVKPVFPGYEFHIRDGKVL
jgi:hypothetical protein